MIRPFGNINRVENIKMNEIDLTNNNDLKYKVYLEERSSLIDAKREGSLLFDKAILTLAAGAFGLSLTFIRQVAPNIIPETIFLLICAWTMFCISLLSTLISFLTSQVACSKQIEILETEDLDNQSNQDKKSYNKLSICTWRLNILSISTFIIGVISLAIFSIFNLLS